MRMAGKGTPGLYEFLVEAELSQYYSGFKNILQVHNVGQLKYVEEDDLAGIGMSKPELRRLKTFFNKYCPANYATKLRKLLGRKDESRDEFLLGEEIAASKPTIKVPAQHVIQSCAVSVYKELGEGEFGLVQQGVWTDEDGMRHQVAVKCLSKKRMQNNKMEFMKEYEMMQSIDHPHIVRLYGVVLDATDIMLITELAPLRSLLECLKEPSLRSTFTVSCLAEFSQQICQGMMYLESKRLIHRDLAARNILVFSRNSVKISDFGLSRALGVGKDYYQTNFNVNLKLPIAWCAPECINFLKFTTASDVWAFGVTMWEMFSYGFQPWAALTGQQILEAIDEPGGQRLEKPLACPREHYQIMEATWRHKPDDRPSFAQLLTMLEEARPEQVQVVSTGTVEERADLERSVTGLLQYNTAEIITVLDKQNHNSESKLSLWWGINSEGKVGWFPPSHTVTYLGTIPGGANFNLNWQTNTQDGGDSQYHPYQNHHQVVTSASSSSLLVGGVTNMFHRTSLRSSKDRHGGSGRKKISRDMISGPTGHVQHTGHIGHDGCYFGDVSGLMMTASGGTNGHLTTHNSVAASATGSNNKFEPAGQILTTSSGVSGDRRTSSATGNGRLPSTGSDNGQTSLSRADSDVSDSVPLIGSSKSSGGGGGQKNYGIGHHKGGSTNPASSIGVATGTVGTLNSGTGAGAASQPRMGHAIGYLRGKQNSGHAANMEKVSPASVNPQNHQYQSISDGEEENDDLDTANDAFGSPLDLGPSLLDEVFNELSNYESCGKLRSGEPNSVNHSVDNLADKPRQRNNHDGQEPDEEEDHEHHHGLQSIVDSCHRLADKVTSTMTLSRTKHKGKKAAYVRPIKASDERTLENAIIMANQIASKSMHDLDKRCLDDMFPGGSPPVSPLTPNTPTKKFSFKFPGSVSGVVSGGGSHKGRSSSPKPSTRHHFSDDVDSLADIEASITPSARDAYKALIDGGSKVPDDKKLEGSQSSLVAPAGGDQYFSSSGTTSYGSSSLHQHRLSLPSTSAPTFRKGPSVVSMGPELRHGEIGTEGRSDSHASGDPVHSTNHHRNNPLPLPPKDRKSSVTAGKRHVRKNPLIIPSKTAASMLSRAEEPSAEEMESGVTPSYNHSTASRYHNNYSGDPSGGHHHMSRLTGPANNSHHQPQGSHSHATQQMGQLTHNPLQHQTHHTNNRSNFAASSNDAFEDEIACGMDALDELAGSSPKTSTEEPFRSQGGGAGGLDTYNHQHSAYQTEDIDDVLALEDPASGNHLPPHSVSHAIYSREDSAPPQSGRPMYSVSAGHHADQSTNVYGSAAGVGVTSRNRRGLDSDEVRIMRKVLGGVSADKTECLAALNLTDWNVHKAIKIVKLKGLIQKSITPESEYKVALINNDWDVARAASYLMKS